jgi:hypothetical protein
MRYLTPLKKLPSCFDELSMNGNSSMLSSEIPVRPEPFDKPAARPETCMMDAAGLLRTCFVEGGTGIFRSIVI